MQAELTPMETLLGKTLLTKKSGPGETAVLLKDKDLVLLYFSASWCPPCKAFTPVLVDFYAQFAVQEKLEIVYVSSDRTSADFAAYYGKMPWLALPNDVADGANTHKRAELARTFKVEGIPTLIVLDAKTGLFVTADARSHVMSAAGSATASQQAIAGWKATTPVPVEEGLAGGSDIVSILKKIFMAILRNPMYIFGTIYMVKWIMRKIAANQIVSGGDDATPTIEPYHEPIPDDEF